MKGKIAIIDSWHCMTAAISRALMYLGDKGIEFVSLADVEKPTMYIEPLPPLPEIKNFGAVRVKPTCKRNHEYIQGKEGKWECRFCANPLK